MPPPKRSTAFGRHIQFGEIDTHVPSQQHFGEISAFARAGRSSRRLIKSQFSDPSHQLSDCVVASKQRRQAYDEGHQIGNIPRLAELQISDYDACSLDIPAANPNFGVARVLIEEQKTIRKIGIELQLPEPLIGSVALLSNTRP